MSERHKEALAHLLYGVSGQGGFVVLTGEVGTGKTTICRCFLQQVPENTDVAFIVNPKLSARELLANICDEFGIQYPAGASIKIYNDLISHYLLQAHSEGRHTVLVIDEAQNLRIDVLEQLRLLTNLETSEKKLLQIILLGQPELHDMLSRQELRQLSQRITARYHLRSLNKEEVTAYIRYRLAVAGQKQDLFQASAIKTIYRKSGGIPRLINLVCDRALLGAYAENSMTVSSRNIKQAFKEIGANKRKSLFTIVPSWVVTGTSIGAVFGAVLIIILAALSANKPLVTQGIEQEAVKVEETDLSIEDNAVLTEGESIAASLTEADTVSDGEDEKLDPKERYGSRYVSSLKYTAPPFNNKLSAYEAVLSQWGVRYSAENNKLVCDFAESQGLSCLHKQGNWRSLIQINRPVVMRLTNQKGQEFFIGLLEIDGDFAKISLGQKTIWTSKEAIDKQWFGDYSVIWRLPPYKSRVIKPGAINDPAKWLNGQILTVKAAQFGSSDEGVFQRDDNSSLEEKVQWFQTSVGLTPDGIAGALTLIHLNNYINPGIPKLFKDTNPLELPKS
ncbi:ExeA family protein [Alkalimarinus alittae]|uniref:AAA family ATPase n=1 Tax=Alkalimarinus alittae TaxID=2961619 RepID=A0ABY6N759_9ALTE|nr:ExeA family protein [Alkalimarinus alittae]UZE97819.1 AAA family ATPase [Alkalimarinus alittae]